MSISNKLDVLQAYLNCCIMFHGCQDQIKYLNIDTEFGTFVGISSFENLLSRIELRLKEYKYVIGIPNNFTDIMKKLNFVDDVDTYTRKFTRVYVINNELFIGHTFNNKKTNFQYEDLKLWIDYFDNI